MPMAEDMKVAEQKCQHITDEKAKEECIGQNMPIAAEMKAAIEKCRPLTDSKAIEQCNKQVMEESMKNMFSGMSGYFLKMLPLYLIFAWMGLAIYAKRLHDRNLSSWWQAAPWIGCVIMYAPLFGLPVFSSLYIAGMVIGAISMIWFLVLFIICGFLKGTNGPNKYGQDPLEKNIVEGVVI